MRAIANPMMTQKLKHQPSNSMAEKAASSEMQT
jgi:hypothetical protein